MPTDCAICTRHRPDPDTGDCTDGCRHHRASVGNVCPGCAARIRRDLDDIGRAWELSAAGPVATGSGTGNERPLPGGTDWIDWRCSGEIEAVLASWARVWHEDTCTEDSALPWPLQTVPALVLWLRVHLEDVGLAHEAVAEFGGDLREWAGRGRRMIGETEVGQVVYCMAEVGDGECGRRLRVDMARPDEVVRCRNCGTEWTSGRLLLLGVSGAADVYCDPEAIGSVIGVDESTLRRWARAGKVRRASGRYLLSDVRAADLARRA